MAKRTVSVELHVCLLLAAVLACAVEPASDAPERAAVGKADLIFTGGTILTMDDARLEAEALAVLGGRIVAVGSEEHVARWRGGETEIVDLAAKTLMPGFVEPHTHPVASAVLYRWIDVSGFGNASAEEAWQKLREAGRRAKPGEWILAFGWDPILLRGAEAPNADVLDRRVSSSNPVWVMLQAMHSHYFNHKALELGGITKDTPDPLGGGYYERDAEGELTGFATESATVAPIVARMPKPSRQESRALLDRMFDRYNAVGITSIGVTGLIDPLMPEAASLLGELTREERAKLRVKTYVSASSLTEGMTERPGTEDDAYQVLGVKFWVDGSPYTGSMLLEEPYLNTDLMQRGLGIAPDTRGHAMLPYEALVEGFAVAHRSGWQISTHSQGDAASRVTMDAYEAVLRASPREDHRHRVEHLVLFPEEGFRRAAELGVTPSFHMLHLYYYGRALRDEIIGPERASRILGVATARKYGHRFSFHADSPMYPPNPLLTVQTAVTRMTREGDVIGGDLAVSVEDALKAVTINPAWQMFMEDEVGSLQVGKYADLVVLSDDPRRVDPDRIGRIGIVNAYLGGRRIVGQARDDAPVGSGP